MRKSNPCLDEANRQRVASWSGQDPLEVYEEIQRTARQFEGPGAEHCIIAVETHYPFNRKVLHTADYAETVMLEFEGMKFPAPAGYSRILSIMYGDYMKFPPVEERGTWHQNLLFEPDVPYKEYLEEYRRRLIAGVK